MGTGCLCLDGEAGSWVRARAKVTKPKYTDCIWPGVCCADAGLLDRGMHTFTPLDCGAVLGLESGV